MALDFQVRCGVGEGAGSSISVTWEFARNANSPAPFVICPMRICVFNQVPQVTPVRITSQL